MQGKNTKHEPDSVMAAVGRLSVARRSVRGGKGGDPEAVAEAQRNLTEAKLERAIRDAVASAPPLSASQRTRLAAILGGGASK